MLADLLAGENGDTAGAAGLNAILSEYAAFGTADIHFQAYIDLAANDSFSIVGNRVDEDGNGVWDTEQKQVPQHILDRYNANNPGNEINGPITQDVLKIDGWSLDKDEIYGFEGILIGEFDARPGIQSVLAGSAKDNIIQGASGVDILLGREGDDQLIARGGDDILDGGSGDDTLLGGNGDDVLIGGAGNDELKGGRGDDRFILDLRTGSENGTDDIYSFVKWNYEDDVIVFDTDNGNETSLSQIGVSVIIDDDNQLTQIVDAADNAIIYATLHGVRLDEDASLDAKYFDVM